MKQTINEYQFRDAFMAIRPDNFSYNGLTALFEWFENYEDETEQETELDVIAICCDFSEMTVDEIINDYIYSESCGNEHVYEIEVWEDIKESDDDEKLEYLIGWLRDRTTVITVDDNSVIIQAF